ncbi:MAG: hypothetical protein JWM68_1918 [Verrucomicrobiales bacterium]|nr:hypothetical protein [Verrucomicrobiales bacterium]
MKKLLLVSAVLFGAVAASQAGVNFSIGIDLPTPPMIFGHRPPVVVAQQPCVSPYAVISAPAPVCVQPPQVVYAPRCEVAPPVVYVPAPVYRYPSRYYHGGYGYNGYGRSGGWGHHGNRY